MKQEVAEAPMLDGSQSRRSIFSMHQNSCLSLVPIEKSNLLLTGQSGVGKSTLIHKISTKLSGQKIQGFVSQVILEGNLRNGWRIDTFDGDGGRDAGVSSEGDFEGRWFG